VRHGCAQTRCEGLDTEEELGANYYSPSVGVRVRAVSVLSTLPGCRVRHGDYLAVEGEKKGITATEIQWWRTWGEVVSVQ